MGRLAVASGKDLFAAGAQSALVGVLSGMYQQLTSRQEQSVLDEELRAAPGDWKCIAVAMLRAKKAAVRPIDLQGLSGLTGDRVSRALNAMARVGLVKPVTSRSGIRDKRAQLYRLRPNGRRLAELSEELYPAGSQADRPFPQFAFKKWGQKMLIDRSPNPKMVDRPGPDTSGINRRLLHSYRIRKREEVAEFPGLALDE
jgi:DNA-binding MarR family transcriptional regulator